MYYLSLTQSGTNVSGYLSAIRPDNQGSTSAENFPVNGSTDDAYLTLVASRLLNLFNVTLTGRRDGANIVLTWPTDSGSVAVVKGTPTTERQFNETLTVWRAELDANYKKRISAEATARAQEEAWQNAGKAVVHSASKLSDDIESLRAQVQEINQTLSSLRRMASNEQTVLENMHKHLDIEKNHAAVRPMTCYQANGTVAYDYNGTLSYDFNGSLNYERMQFGPASKKLDALLSGVSASVEQSQRDRRALDAAIAVPHPKQTINAKPGDEEGPIATLLTTAAAAQKEFGTLKATDATILNTATGYMTEGKSIMESAQALVKC